MGKLPPDQLRKLLSCIKQNSKVIVPPELGFDSGVHTINENELLVVSTDPCIGVPKKWFGWLLIQYAASDVALFGAQPEFCAITLLGPPSTKAQIFTEVMKQACGAADALKMAVVAGHTGTYEGLLTLVGTCTAYGLIQRENLVTPAGAQAGDHIVCTKQIGLEAAVNFALTHRSHALSCFTATETSKLQKLVKMQTCVKEALLLAENQVHAMHDITEGGLVEALNEMAKASDLGFILDFEKLPILQEVMKLKRHFNLSQQELLSLSSSGSILAAINPETKVRVLRELRKHGIAACLIGVFTKNKKRIIRFDDKKTAFPKVAADPYGKIMMKEHLHVR